MQGMNDFLPFSFCQLFSFGSHLVFLLLTLLDSPFVLLVDDEIEVEDVLADLDQRFEGNSQMKLEPVEELTDDFVGQSYDSIDAGDLSRSGLGNVILPSIFGTDTNQLRTL